MSFVYSCSKLMKASEHQRYIDELKKNPEILLAMEFEAKKKYYEMKKAAAKKQRQQGELVNSNIS